MTLQEAKNNIGKWVVYTPFDGCSKDQKEIGIITSVNESYVFVRYGNELHSKATLPEDLKF
jgi:hypothetical protein